jgi:hypothetical protein
MRGTSEVPAGALGSQRHGLRAGERVAGGEQLKAVMQAWDTCDREQTQWWAWGLAPMR